MWIVSYQKRVEGKPLTPLHAERAEKSAGVEICQDAKSVDSRLSTGSARHADGNEHGAAQETDAGIVASVSDIACPLRLPLESEPRSISPESDYAAVSEAAGF